MVSSGDKYQHFLVPHPHVIARVDKIWNTPYNRLVKQHGLRVS